MQIIHQGGTFKIQRRYFEGFKGFNQTWETIYDGDLAGAIRSYNLLG